MCASESGRSSPTSALPSTTCPCQVPVLRIRQVPHVHTNIGAVHSDLLWMNAVRRWVAPVEGAHNDTYVSERTIGIHNVHDEGAHRLDE